MISYGRWTLSVGDPTFLGWITCFLYFCTGICSLIAYKKSIRIANRTSSPTNLLVWLSIGILFLLLSANKQLDLHCLITEFGRKLAHNQGWYQYRREVQLIFMISLLSLCIFILSFTYKKLQYLSKQQMIALAGTACTILYALLKAFSFHHLDRWFPFASSILHFLWILEIGGIVVVLCALLQYLLQPSSR